MQPIRPWPSPQDTTYFVHIYGNVPSPKPLGLEPDRLYVWVRPELRDLMQNDYEVLEKAPLADHHLPDRPGIKPDFSRKHNRLQSGNPEFTSYKETDSKGNVVAEVDIDYHADKAAHILLEGLPHLLAKARIPFLEKRSDPKIIHILRWIEEKQRGGDFQPLYKVLKT